MTFTMARSKAGHDRNCVYVVISEDGEDVLVADGRRRCVANPKRKRRTHLQPIVHIPDEVSAIAADQHQFTDDWIKKVIVEYSKKS